MAKRGLKKGSKCIRRRRNGRCAEFSKGRKGPGRPKKRKDGKAKRELSFLEKMERKFRRKKGLRLYSAPDYAERMRKEREAAQEAAQIAAMRKSAAEFTPTSLFGARRRRSR